MNVFPLDLALPTLLGNAKWKMEVLLPLPFPLTTDNGPMHLLPTRFRDSLSLLSNFLF